VPVLYSITFLYTSTMIAQCRQRSLSHYSEFQRLPEAHTHETLMNLKDRQVSYTHVPAQPIRAESLVHSQSHSKGQNKTPKVHTTRQYEAKVEEADEEATHARSRTEGITRQEDQGGKRLTVRDGSPRCHTHLAPPQPNSSSNPERLLFS
jgi:hypothetical protein